MTATYPFSKYMYKVYIEGLEAARFSEITGVNASVDMIEYRESNMMYTAPPKLPNLLKYNNLTFKWGVTASKDAYDWMSSSFGTDITRKTVSVALLNECGDEVAIWQIVSAWPVKYSGSEFNATSSEAAIELLELAHEGLTRTA